MIRSALGSGSLKKSPDAVATRPARPAAAMCFRATGSTGGRSKDVQRRCGCRRATSMHSNPVAPPTSQSVLNGEKSNFSANASKLMRDSPVIAPMNCSSRGRSLYSSSNIGFWLCLTSFCGFPVRSASGRSCQNLNSRALSISRIPPTYRGLARSRYCNPAGVLK